jgi:hypothetical protein
MTGRAALLPAVVLAAGFSVGMALSAGGASAASKADIQWAQTVLKERGFDPGPARGELNERTRSALSAFQKKNGIPVTGRLDDATVQRLMQGRETSSTMGNLAAPRSSNGAGGGASSAGRGAAEPAKPKAAPTTAVQSSGPAVENLLESVRRSDAPASSGGDPAPSAAPRAAITADGAAAGAQTGAVAGAGQAEGGFDLSRLVAPAWVRGLIWVLVAAVALAGGLVWWLSGRRPRAGKGRPVRGGGPAPLRERREPTLGAARGPELRADRL